MFIQLQIANRTQVDGGMQQLPLCTQEKQMNEGS